MAQQTQPPTSHRADESDRTGTAADCANDTTGQPGLPQAPEPKPTEPLYLRDTAIDYTKPKSHLLEPDCAVYGDECSAAATGEYDAAGLAAAGREDLSEPVGCGGAGA